MTTEPTYGGRIADQLRLLCEQAPDEITWVDLSFDGENTIGVDRIDDQAQNFYDAARAAVPVLLDKVTRLQAENARLRAALEWYADPISSAVTQISEPRSAVHADRGRRARAALGPTQ